MKKKSKKSKWMKPEKYYVPRNICSNCGRFTLDWDKEELLTPFCPWCGSKMENPDPITLNIDTITYDRVINSFGEKESFIAGFEFSIDREPKVIRLGKNDEEI